MTSYPTSIGTSDETSIQPAGARPRRRPARPGRVRRAGVLAGGPAPADGRRAARLRGGAGRARRPRVHALGDRCAAHPHRRARVGPGGHGGRAARGRLPVPGRRPRTPVGSWRRRWRRTRSAGDLPTTDEGWDDLARDAVAGAADGRGARPRAGPPGPPQRGPADAGAAADRHRGGRARPAPAAARGGRPGAPGAARPHPPVNGAGVCGAALCDLGLPRRDPARASPCWPGRPGWWGTSPRRCAARSGSTSTPTSSARRTTGPPGGSGAGHWLRHSSQLRDACCARNQPA